MNDEKIKQLCKDVDDYTRAIEGLKSERRQTEALQLNAGMVMLGSSPILPGDRGPREYPETAFALGRETLRPDDAIGRFEECAEYLTELDKSIKMGQNELARTITELERQIKEKERAEAGGGNGGGY
jgi:hypothetical protein